MPFLQITDLRVAVGNKVILKQCTLSLPPHGIHVIMGPNGSGKSTLCGAIMGKEGYSISGTIRFAGKNLCTLSPDARARLGIFLGFQHPMEIPGVTLFQCLRATLEARGEKRSITELSAGIKRYLAELHLGEEFMNRALNEHASGGEKKRLEMVQLLVLGARLAILDEIDSGLDIDSLRIIAGAIRRAAAERGTAFLIITHYQRLLEHLAPDRVHVMMSGMIVKSGGQELAAQLEREGYQEFTKQK